MELFDGFAWPVPVAFRSAVASCRFEQGDLLYDDPAAYEGPWPPARPGLRLQVLDPPRSARGPSEGEGRRFDASWEAPVEVELHAPGDGGPRRHVSTQGRLFTCLWRGDPAVLDPESAAPPVPGLARDLQPELAAALPGLRAAALAAFAKPPAAGLLFATVLDRASDGSLARAEASERALAAAFELRAVALAPAEALGDGAAAFHPALRFRALAIASEDADAVRERLKPILYAGAGEGDRFSLDRHGLLAPLFEPPEEEPAEAGAEK